MLFVPVSFWTWLTNVVAMGVALISAVSCLFVSVEYGALAMFCAGIFCPIYVFFMLRDCMVSTGFRAELMRGRRVVLWRRDMFGFLRNSRPVRNPCVFADLDHSTELFTVTLLEADMTDLGEADIHTVIRACESVGIEVSLNLRKPRAAG